MAGFFDSAVTWLGNNADTIVDVGQQAYGIYNSVQTAGQVSDASSPGGITDPFGAERPQYQQKLSQLFNDPSYLQNLPGYQFQQQMGEQAINRGAAKSGHFNSPNRLYELSKFNQGLAGTRYDTSVNQLSTLAGAGITPDAGSALKGMEGASNLNVQAASTGGGLLDNIIGLFDGAGGGSANPTEGDSAESGPNGSDLSSLTTGNVWEGLGAAYALGGGAVERAEGLAGLTGDADMGGAGFASYYADQSSGAGVIDSIKGFASEYGLDDLDYAGMASALASGEDPKEVLKGAAVDYAKEAGTSWLKGEGADLIGQATGIDMTQFGLGDAFSAANELGGGATDAAKGLANLTGNADLGGPMGNSYGPATDAAATGGSGVASAAAGVGSLVGGFAGNYLATKYIDDNPVIGTLGSIGGGIAGAGVGGAIGGAVAGTGAAAGATAGIAAAGAAAGPLAAVAVAAIIAQGIYGVHKGAQARDQKRDDYRRVQGEMTSSGLVDDPTGGGYGQGYMHESQGYTFFAPSKYYTSVNNKRNYGEYLDDDGSLQGSYAAWQNPEGEWIEGVFGAGSGSSSFDASSWQAMSSFEGKTGFSGRGGATSWAEAQSDKTSQMAADRRKAQLASELYTQDGEGAGQVSPTATASNWTAAGWTANAAGDGYTKTQAGEGGTQSWSNGMGGGNEP